MHREQGLDINRRLAWCFGLALFLLLALSGCGDRYERAVLSTTAPEGLTVQVGAAQEYSITGGKSPYAVTSNNPGVLVAAVSGSRLTLGGVASGSAEVTIRDAEGETTSLSVAVSAGVQRGLFTTAPANVTVAAGASAAQTYTIAGGSAPYSASSSNANVAQAAVSGSSLTITGVAAGAANIVVTDRLGATETIGVLVPSGTPLYSTAPSAISLAIGAAPIYRVGGGSGVFDVESSDENVATATLSGPSLTINSLASGNATIVITDTSNSGAKLSIAVSVRTASSQAFYTTAPASVTVGVGQSPVYSVGGGTGPYEVETSNENVVGVELAGSSLSVTGLSPGSATVKLTDKAGSTVSIAVTVPSAATVPLYTTAPASTSISVGATNVYRVVGGIAPYEATASNDQVLSVSLAGSDLTVTGLLPGNAAVQVRDAVGSLVSTSFSVLSLPVAVTPSSASGIINDLLVATITGGTPPYRVQVNNDRIATATVVSQNRLEISLLTGGTTEVRVFDFNDLSAAYTVTVTTAPDVIRLSPSAVAVSENDTQPIMFTVFSAAPGPVSLFSSDTTLLQAAITGNVVTVTTGSKGNRCVSGSAGAAYPVTITVVDSTRAVGTATVSVLNSEGGCP